MPAKKNDAVEAVKDALPVVTVDGELTSQIVLAYFKDPEAVPYIASFKEDPEVVAARINAQQMGAQSAEELFGPSDVLHGKEHTGKPFLFTEVHYQPSDIEGEGLPIYGVYTVGTVDGEVKTMTCGARSVVLKLAKADAEGWLPLWLKLTKAEKPTPAGYYPLDVVTSKGPDTAADGTRF